MRTYAAMFKRQYSDSYDKKTKSTYEKNSRQLVATDEKEGV